MLIALSRDEEFLCENPIRSGSERAHMKRVANNIKLWDNYFKWLWQLARASTEFGGFGIVFEASHENSPLKLLIRFSAELAF